MIGNARGSHSSPGIYMKEVALSYASKNLGITTLGVVGETLKGPAFEPIRIENWGEFVDYFGGTSPEKFKGTQYPKYELPYIAKTYLKHSNNLEVCRVLGLSGYNAGPAWVITAEDKDKNKYAVAVLRSRGYYSNRSSNSTGCDGDEQYDNLIYSVDGDVTLEKYTSSVINMDCDGTENFEGGEEEFTVAPYKYGKFNIKCNNKVYPVSLNPGDSDYIINVLGTNPTDGYTPLFVEEMYDIAYMGMVDSGMITTLSEEVTPINEGLTADDKPVTPKAKVASLKIDESELKAGHVGLLFLDIENGTIDKVIVKKEGNRKSYKYEEEENTFSGGDIVLVLSEDRFYKYSDGKFNICGTDVNDYKEMYRCASTPWIVSELKGDKLNGNVKKLFRFHTISDGNTANTEVKVSIQNIKPDEGLFDIVIRKFDDMDASPVVLERFTRCSMVQGTNNFIGFKIGTFDGEYIVKSKYVTVEVIANDLTETCVPAGFLGYPMRVFENIKKPDMGYYTELDEDIRVKKQYFGFSTMKGIDVDLFKYKGKNAYSNINSLGKGFHLDSRIETLSKDGFTLTVDGEAGYKLQTVSPNNILSVTAAKTPLIGAEVDMIDTIYEDINARKFTVCFYGGFDGWDPYRNERTNGDAFKANKYRGKIGYNFSEINDGDALNLTGKCINSDYYAYLAGAKQFSNIEAVDINVFATPGIDYVNQPMLTREILTMVSEERGDSLYVMTTPDKPAGATSDIFYPDEVVANLQDAEVNSSYAATYYPWVKYYDKDNSCYINLPATKDALAAMAYTDNISYPWFAPAGTVRGSVECERASFITKLEDEDILYEAGINPIKTFAADGVKIWGQKTTDDTDTPLNRINVRRLMLRVKKLISGACRRLIFEQNDSTVKRQFEGLVKPILDDIKSKRGIYDYRLQIDDSAEARDRLELPATIYIKPTKALEYIDLSFVIAPESVSFDE